MLIESLAAPFVKARTTSCDHNGFQSRIPVRAEPLTAATATTTSQEVFPLADVQGYQGAIRSGILVIPYGTGSDDNTFSVRVIAWNVIGSNTPGTQLWVPLVLAEVQCTLGTTTGIAGCQVANTELFADTITLTTGNANVSIDINSPADNTIAHFVIGVKGAQKLEFNFTTGGVATDCNCLWRKM